MSAFCISQRDANMQGCKDVWPTNLTLFEAASAKVPEYAGRLQELLLDVKKGMLGKTELEEAISWWHAAHEIDYVPSRDWPTNTSTFNFVISLSLTHTLETWHRLWNIANDGYLAKKSLDEAIVEILDGQVIVL
jgi:hypothetical protein